MNNPIRPLKYLRIATEFYPDISQNIHDLRQRKGKDLPDWPDYCYLPLTGWQAIVKTQRDRVLASEVARIAALGTWMDSRGIYRINNELMKALVQSNIFGNLPSDVLLRLPDHCIYIETPGFNWLRSTLHGYWAHREWNAQTEKPELRLLLDTSGGLIHLVLPVGAWTVMESVRRTVEVNARIDQLNKILLPLLYVCSEDYEIKQCNESLPNQEPHELWLVGERMGEKLYSASKYATMIRKGHWHGYWTNSKSGGNQFVFRWISPVDQ